MSVYTLLSTQVPTLAFCTIRRRPADASKEDFYKQLKEQHSQLRAQSDALGAAFRKLLSDTASREVHTVRGMLSPYLHTPISSDDADVRRALLEAFERLMKQWLDADQPGVKHASEGRITFPSMKKSREKKLLDNGKRYLAGRGLDIVKEKGELLESMFFLHGSANLDVLEWLMHGSMPLDSTPTEGTGVKQPLNSLHSLLFAKGDMASASVDHPLIETAVSFSRPHLNDASFHDGLLEGVENLYGKFVPDQIALWRQKLGLGAGREYILRIVGKSIEKPMESILWIESMKSKTFLKQAIIDQGCLIVKELFM